MPIKQTCRCLRWFQISFGVILTILPLALWAKEPGARLEIFLERVHSLRAEFQQTLLDKHNEPLEESRGIFLLQRPDKFRWSYRRPFHQEIVADGEHIWFYSPDLEQVTVKDQEASLGDTPALLLSGERLPYDRYRIHDLPSHNGLTWVELLPRDQDAAFEQLLLGFDKHSLRLMELHDSFGRTTRLAFSEVKINMPIDPAQFVFTPPEGVDIIGNLH